MSVQITHRLNRFPESACSSLRQREQGLNVRLRQVKRGRLSETGDRLSGGRTAQAAKTSCVLLDKAGVTTALTKSRFDNSAPFVKIGKWGRKRAFLMQPCWCSAVTAFAAPRSSRLPKPPA